MGRGGVSGAAAPGQWSLRGNKMGSEMNTLNKRNMSK